MVKQSEVRHTLYWYLPKGPNVPLLCLDGSPLHYPCRGDLLADEPLPADSEVVVVSALFLRRCLLFARHCWCHIENVGLVFELIAFPHEG